MSAVSIRAVDGRRDLDRFLRLPWRIYADDSHWVPPLLSDVRAALDQQKHPFHQHADVALFLAERNGEAVGRIAAIINHAHNDFHEDAVGFFGLFESIDDQAVASALLAAAEDWLRARGRSEIQGPFNLSTNDEICSPGVLVEGFDRPPVILMAHNPPGYGPLIEQTGYSKVMDLLAYWDEQAGRQTRIARVAERIARTEGYSIRSIDMRRFDQEVATIQDIYNSAWERNWGFVPMTAAEIDHMARQLRPILNPRLCAIAEVGGEPVGFALGLPDYNQALRHVNGRLFPLGFLKLLWHRRNIDAARVITFGIRPGYRNRGLDALLLNHLIVEGDRSGLTRAECSWILEDNWDIRRTIEKAGGHVYKRYRVYGKPLS